MFSSLRFPAMGRYGWLLPLAMLLGCGGGTVVVDQPLDPTHERLMKIGNAYTAYLEETGQPPRSEKQLRQALAEQGNPDELLRSPRDGQPFVICWGVDLFGGLDWAQNTPVLAYEKQGTGEKRYVLTAIRSVQEISEDEFQQASFPPGHQVHR